MSSSGGFRGASRLYQSLRGTDCVSCQPVALRPDKGGCPKMPAMDPRVSVVPRYHDYGAQTSPNIG